MKRFLPIALVAAVLAGCAVGPDYSRPAVNPPAGYRTAGSDALPDSGTNTLAQMGWWEVFRDPQLTAYLGEALTNSWDVRIAAARVLQAEAAARITRSQFYPNVSAGGDWATTRASETGPNRIPAGVNPQSEYGSVHVSMSAYEVDLWGRIRRANEGARARLLATIEAENAVRQALVSLVATAYLEMLELDLELEVARRTLSARTNSLELTRARQEGGVASMQDGELSVRASVGRPSGVEPSVSVAASARVDWFKHAARDTAQPATRTTRAVASAATCLEAYLSTACRGGLGGIAAPDLFVPGSSMAGLSAGRSASCVGTAAFRMFLSTRALARQPPPGLADSRGMRPWWARWTGGV